MHDDTPVTAMLLPVMSDSSTAIKQTLVQAYLLTLS